MATVLAGDRLWQYLFELQKTCVFACNISAAECSKRNIPLDAHWAAAIAEVAKIDGVPAGDMLAGSEFILALDTAEGAAGGMAKPCAPWRRIIIRPSTRRAGAETR